MDYVKVTVPYLYFIRNECDGHTKQGRRPVCLFVKPRVQLRNYYYYYYYHRYYYYHHHYYYF